MKNLSLIRSLFQSTRITEIKKSNIILSRARECTRKRKGIFYFSAVLWSKLKNSEIKEDKTIKHLKNLSLIRSLFQSTRITEIKKSNIILYRPRECTRKRKEIFYFSAVLWSKHNMNLKCIDVSDMKCY